MTNEEKIKSIFAEYMRLVNQIISEGCTVNGRLNPAYRKMCKARKEYRKAEKNRKIRRLYE